MAVNQGSLAFVADAVIAYLRSEQRPRPIPDEAIVLTRLPIVNALRNRIEPKDKEWVLEMVKGSGNLAKLGVSLVKNLAKQTDVQDLLRSKFVNSDDSLRSWLFWKILDDPNLDPDWHERLFRFAMATWERLFRADTLEHFGTPDQILPLVLRRIADASVPPSKQWCNLLCLLVASDQAAAKAEILRCRASLDDFGKKVADELLRKFFEPPGSENQ